MKLLIIPLLAAVLQAVGLLLAKVGLTRRRIKLRDYIPGVFLFLSIFSVGASLLFGYADFDVLSGGAVMAKLLLVIFSAVIWNICYYIGISKEKANTTEGIMITMPLATIAISWLFDWSKFSTTIAAVAILATLITAASYSINRSLKLDKYSLLLGLAVIFIGVENVLVSQVLQTGAISPITLYALRSLAVFLIFFAYYRPKLRRVSAKHHSFMAFSALLGSTMMILRFYGLRDAGITITAIVLILSPAFVLLLSGTFLHERLKIKRIVSTAVVLGLVISAVAVNYQSLLPE
ncbi:MAG: DMT family transporter [Patescibacteria group bacterium]